MLFIFRGRPLFPSSPYYVREKKGKGGTSIAGQDPLASPGILDYSVVMEAEPFEMEYIAGWLKWQMSPEQLEHRHPDLSKEWSTEIANGAETWFYRSPAEFWEGMCGREGIALVKDGEVPDDHLSVMN